MRALRNCSGRRLRMASVSWPAPSHMASGASGPLVRLGACLRSRCLPTRRRSGSTSCRASRSGAKRACCGPVAGPNESASSWPWRRSDELAGVAGSGLASRRVLCPRAGRLRSGRSASTGGCRTCLGAPKISRGVAAAPRNDSGHLILSDGAHGGAVALSGYAVWAPVAQW